MLGLLGALAAALPGEHRPLETRLVRRRPGLLEAAIAVHQETACDLGQPQAKERVHVELIPEHVAPVGLAVQPARGHACVKVGGMTGAHLQDVADVQPQQALDLLIAADTNVTHAPELLPRVDVSR